MNVLIILLAIIGVTQDLMMSRSTHTTWDEVYLRSALTQARVQSWEMQPIALTRDRGIKALAVGLPDCQATSYVMPLLSGGEFFGVVEQFRQSLGHEQAFYFRGQWHRELPMTQYWLFRTLGSVPWLSDSEKIRQQTAVVAFWDDACELAPSQLSSQIEITFSGANPQ